jgi:acetyltransferase-like isoleucine patch superfamily enzyme
MLENKPKLKKILHRLMVHQYATRPRLWVRIFVYPFCIKRGKGSIIKRTARLDIFPTRKCTLGYRAIIDDYAIVNNGMGDVLIGDRSTIASRAKVVGPVTIGNCVMLGSGSQITGLTHNYLDVTCPIKDQGVTPNLTVIEDDVWIHGNVAIIQGIRIGTHCIIGAGSVVTKDMPPYSIIAGNPARVIKQYNQTTGTWEKVARN